MSRVIKFRWWNGVRMISHSNLVVGAKNLRSPEHMQFTGLKDCKGVEIYEGDIVETKGYPFYTEEGRNYLGEVAWFKEDACWHVFLHVVSDRVVGRASGDALGNYIEERSDFEVLGNIHENHELLANQDSHGTDQQ